MVEFRFVHPHLPVAEHRDRHLDVRQRWERRPLVPDVHSGRVAAPASSRPLTNWLEVEASIFTSPPPKLGRPSTVKEGGR